MNDPGTRPPGGTPREPDRTPGPERAPGPEAEQERVRRRLRAAAAAHRPDRARMLARVERGMRDEAEGGRLGAPRAAAGAARSRASRGHKPGTGGPRKGRPPGPEALRPLLRPWLRAGLVGGAVAGVLAGTGFAATVLHSGGPESGRQTAASSAPSTPTPSRPSPSTPSPSSSSPRDDESQPDKAPRDDKGQQDDKDPRDNDGSPDDTTPPADNDTRRDPSSPAQESAGPLWSDGSVDPHSNLYWAQSNVTLQTARPLTSLTVELRVARTAGVSPTGNWRTLPEKDFTFRTTTEDGFLVHRWTLRPGSTVPPGRHIFAGQYDHAQGGRDAGRDTYSATARTATGELLHVKGDFAPHRR